MNLMVKMIGGMNRKYETNQRGKVEEITVKSEGPGKHIVCKPCLDEIFTLKHWGIKVHRIAKKWTFPEWMITKIKE